MADLERTYNVPLRKEFQKAPRHKRAHKAVRTLKDFLRKHMKSEDVRLGRHLNQALWGQGMRNPPHHIKVSAVRDDQNVVRAELLGHKYQEGKPEKKEEKGKLAEAVDKLKGKKEEKPEKKGEKAKEEKPEKEKEEKREQKAEEPKPEKKEEKKEGKENLKTQKPQEAKEAKPSSTGQGQTSGKPGESEKGKPGSEKQTGTEQKK